MSVIDVHTHALSNEFITLLKKHGSKDYSVETPSDASPIISMQGVTFRTNPKMYDYDLRIKDMDDSGIDVSIISLTTPNVFWDSREGSIAAARVMNDNMAAAQGRYPDRVRFLASLPWEYADEATAELKRARAMGAIGVVVLGHIRGKELIDPLFAPTWELINSLGITVQVHPNVPANARAIGLPGILQPVFGFTFDTGVAFAKMILSGFLDKYPNVKFLALHGGGALPYHAGRLDMFFDHLPPEQRKISGPPSAYLRRLYYDAAVYDSDALDMLIRFAGADRVLFGTDYPHPTDVTGIIKRIDSANCSSNQRRMILGGSAERLFGL